MWMGLDVIVMCCEAIEMEVDSMVMCKAIGMRLYANNNVLEYHKGGDIGHCYALGGNMCEVRAHNNMLGGHMN